jgi:hypothetical protein
MLPELISTPPGRRPAATLRQAGQVRVEWIVIDTIAEFRSAARGL